jgi:predicted nuclease with RNAse H fold
MPINYKDYPPEFPEISKRIRFERANNCCEWCGAKNYEPHPITGSKVILTVAHLNHIKEDCRDDNLRALCQRCHLNYDRPHHIANRKRNAATRREEETGQMRLL